MSSLSNIVIFLSLTAAASESPSVGLHPAVSRGDASSVRVELDKGVDPNRKNPDKLTPLHLAARQGHLEISRLLLEKGADPNRMQDTTARTPLHLAVQHQHEQVTRLLLERGANPNLVARYGKRETLVPLQLAARSADGEIARLLLRYGARLGGRCSGCGPQLLHLAAGTGHVGLARLLLAQGVDPSTPLDGLRPAQIAARRGHLELARLLGGSEAELEAPSADGGADGQRASTQARANVFGSQRSQELLEGAKQWALSFTANLPDFFCTQITTRSDNQGRENTALKKRHDIVTKVQFVDGAESYMTLTVDGKPSQRHVREISGMGEFGSALQALFQPDSPASFFHEGDSLLEGQPAVVFAVTHPSGYQLYTGVLHDGTLQNFVRVGYEGHIHIAKDSSAVLRIVGERIFGVPADFPVRQARFQIDYGPVDIEGRTYWLPLSSRDVLVGRRSWINQNENKWMNYRRFATKTTLDFGK
ncbi:MAG: ankyrin repeat domain-containing protein [Acidobacteriota bacterium]|nr:ankyrin repeat domain-containing protein [Acidobacteriota bacterium]